MEETTKPLITCVTATYGRLSHLREALSCFLVQDYPNKELVILNNHPHPMKCDVEGVRVVNECGHPTLGHCRNRLIDFINGEYVNTWDDDDWWRPWHLSQCMEYIRKYKVRAWKPTFSWFNNNGKFTLLSNVMEASILIEVELIRKYKYKESAGDEHEPLMQGIHHVCRNDDVGERASYIYNWGNGLCHASGKINHPTESLQQRTEEWQSKHQDVGDILEPVPYSEIEEKIMKGIHDAK